MPQRPLTRRALAAAFVMLHLPPAAASPFRGDDIERLPDHAALWNRLPLPFTPAQAWRLLSPSTQAEIGAAVIGMALAEYIAGDGMAEADQFLDEDLRSAANDTQHDLLNRIGQRLWVLLPDLYGPDGDHPAWALAGGLAR